MDNESNLNKLESDIAAELKPVNGEGDPQRQGLKQAMAAVDKATSMPRANFTAVAHSSSARSATVPGYEELMRILTLAYEQAAHGKGRERHSTNLTGFKPWDRQPILELARMTGPGSSAYQVMKKSQEACMFMDKHKFVEAKAEVLGAIVYAAALYKLIEEIETPTN